MANLIAWERFVTNFPESQREYRTIEIWHPQFAQPYRFVSNYVNIDLTLEAGAPRDPSSSVTFTGSTLRIVEPSEREDMEQVLSVDFGNTDSTIHEIVDQVAGTGYLSSAEVIYRKYYSGDLTEPATPPLYLFASSLDFNDTSVSFSAEDADLSQKRSGVLYTLELFPGLSA